MFKRAEESKKIFDDILGHLKRGRRGEFMVGCHLESEGSPVVTPNRGRLTSPGVDPGAQAYPGQVV